MLDAMESKQPKDQTPRVDERALRLEYRELDDAALVAEYLAGRRIAFQELVEHTLLNVDRENNAVGSDPVGQMERVEAVPAPDIGDNIAVSESHDLKNSVRRLRFLTRLHEQYVRIFRGQYSSGDAFLRLLCAGDGCNCNEGK